MEYHAAQLIQIRSDAARKNGLVYSEDRGDATPLCGTVNRDWRGRQMHYVQVGAGRVTCKRCANIVHEHHRAAADAENERERKAKEEATRADRVRDLRTRGVRVPLPELDALLRSKPAGARVTDSVARP